jgi:hypothetical protein
MVRTIVILAFVAAVSPTPALAQAAIAGSVTDPSGAPVAGVFVEATSTALIEQRRTTVTDASGRYRVENLRPGVYSVRLTHPGWKPFVHQGVEVTGSATATVDAQLVLGTLTDTVTVTGAATPLDVQSARQEVTLSGEVVRTLPTVRAYNSLVGLVPGVVTSLNDIVTMPATMSFPIHGGRTSEGRLLLDGLTVGSPPSGNSATSYAVDVGNAHEITFSTGAASGEAETAGLMMNIVPRAGGNRTRGSFYVAGTGEGLQADNLTPSLRDRGVMSATPLSDVYDISGSLGGPILTDRLWYFATAHTGSSTRENANVYYNLNAGDATKWLYSPDLRHPAYSDRTFENASLQLTWQASPRHKFGAFWDAQALCRTCTGATPGLAEPQRISPEAVGVLGRPLHVTQAKWSSPLTDHWLLEAGYGGTFFGVGNFEREPNPTRDLIRVAEQCANGCAANGGIPGLVYRSQDFSVAHTGSYLWKASASYVTGSHTLKLGAQHTFMTDDRTWLTNNQHLTYRVNNGVPNQLTQSISPWVNDARATWSSVFAEHRWTRGNLTLQGALRFDRARSWFPEQRLGPSRFLPEALMIPETRGVDSYKDITPRVGAAYDVFGNGETALKVYVGKYLEGVGVSGIYANTNPTLRMPQTTMVFGTAGVTRAWTDANRNFVAVCDLLNPNAQDLRATGGDLCGVLSNTNFGRPVLTNNFDPRVLAGWGVRPSDWNFAASIEHTLLPRATVSVSYHRRYFSGFTVVDNLALQPADLTPFSLTAPLDPRLPDGGGYVVSGLYDVVPDKAGQVANLITTSDDFGAWTQRFQGVDASVSVRTGGFTLVAGTSAGQSVADNCEVRAQLPELSTAITGASSFGPGLVGSAVTAVSPYCRVAYGVLTQFRGLSSYEIPAVGVHLSATFQSKPGPMLSANYVATNAEVAASLGRSLSGNAPNVTVNLIPPGTLYGDRINELDVRVAKTLRFGRARSILGLEIYNVLNSSAVLSYNMAFVPGGTWLQPITILTPRFLKLTAEFDF